MYIVKRAYVRACICVWCFMCMCFLYIPIIVWMSYWFPILTTSIPLFLSNIHTPTYLPILISVFLLISSIYCVSYIQWRPLALLVQRLSISISLYIHLP